MRNKFRAAPIFAGALAALLSVFAVSPAVLAHEIPIETPIQVRAEAGKAVERTVALIFDDLDLSIRDRESREVVLKLEFSKITKITYEFSAQPKAFGSSSVAQPGTAIGEKRHWLTFYYQQVGKPAYLLLALDNYDFEDVVHVTEIITEKSVEGAPAE